MAAVTMCPMVRKTNTDKKKNKQNVLICGPVLVKSDYISNLSIGSRYYCSMKQIDFVCEIFASVVKRTRTDFFYYETRNIEYDFPRT